ncbi:AlpA family transcriptional regulator [Mesorhizobium sp. B2-3-11]|uniref:helix-turn-helix transcriptional regulator n=1 Tax=Mesorhizobium sp. B2-3-11 TaxID=2589953 RepID=UPI00112CE883|nr:AlpA family transcriptional regulator [Mesorhizobium sp. B2-3-11]TPM11282.1 AlpA family transcriptional regulator [Mesorhizobium sp. B2-3-11]
MQLLGYEALKTKGIGFSRPHIWRLMKAGEFPKPIKLGSSRNAWLESEIDAYIERKIAARDREVA